MEKINAHKIASEEVIATSSSESYGNSVEFMILQKSASLQENMVVGEQIEVNENIVLHRTMSENHNSQSEDIATSLSDSILENKIEKTYTEVYNSSFTINSDNMEKSLDDCSENKSMALLKVKKEEEKKADEACNTDDESQEEDETIATFVTAAGQQLALYAVEDSEDIFAVSLYDESGKPPTNFQFLMKVDVERLIGEGAVRTVKKPSQIKKHLLTTQPPIFFPKQSTINEELQRQNDEVFEDDLMIDRSTFLHNSDLLQEGEEKDLKVIDSPKNLEDSMNDRENEEEFMEQSTVQYILFNEDQSESELTFAEVESTLRNMKERIALKKSNRKLDETRNSLNKITAVNSESSEMKHPECRTKRSRKQQLTSVNRDDSEIIIQPASVLSETEGSPKARGKRRKVVTHQEYRRKKNHSKGTMRIKHREIEIIDIDVEEEENVLPAKKNIVEITIDDSKDKYSSDKENDIIMVGDTDEEEQEENDKSTGSILQCELCSRRFRQKRALDTHSRVCSKSSTDSGDNRLSDEFKRMDNVAKKKIIKQYACKICQEKFQVVVALARHVRLKHSQRKKRVSSKSSAEESPSEEPISPSLNNLTINADKAFDRASDRPSDKMSDKLFDKIPDKTSNRTYDKASDRTSDKAACKRTSKSPGRIGQRQRLYCKDCGRCFPSAALLAAHSSVLHDSRKAEERKVRRCHICKKLIKSRILFIRHLKTHANAKLYPGISTLRKKLRSTRQTSRKITALRKRGKPRKL